MFVKTERISAALDDGCSREVKSFEYVRSGQKQYSEHF